MLRLPFELGLALRYLRPRGTPVSIITLICVLGVMLGVAILIIVIAVMSGFGEQLRAKLLGFNSHLRIRRHHDILDNWRPLMEKVRLNPRVQGVAPFVEGQVLVMTQSKDTNAAPTGFGVIIRGVDPKLESAVSILPSSIREGAFDLSGDSVLVGRVLADNLGLKVGDKLAMASPVDIARMYRSREAGRDEARYSGNFYIRGIFDVDYYEFNASRIVTKLGNAQDFYALNDEVHGLFVRLKLSTEDETERARIELEKSFGHEFEVVTWMEENSVMLGAIAVEKNMMYYILFFIMIVAAFCIICSQLAFVMQKTREIGVLKALGATTGQIVRLFLVQSSIVGFSGVLAGVAFGLLAVRFRNEFLYWMRKVTGTNLFPSDIYFFSELPAKVVVSDLVLICGVSLVMCLVAGLVPAWIAASMKPVEAMRHE